MPDMNSIPLTPLIREYRRIKGLSQAVQKEEADRLLGEAGGLAALVVESTATFASYDNRELAFHPVRPTAAPNPRSHTAQYACALARQPATIPGYPFLEFAFVDRELIPTRTTGGALFDDDSKARSGARLDLLLRGHDGLPIVAEVKVRRDATPFVALIQALALATLMVSEPQRARMAEHYPEARLTWPGGAPLVDVYVILLDSPASGRYWGTLLEAADKLAAGVMHDEPAAMILRRIVCLTGAVSGSTHLEVRFAYGPMA
jgi:hypothetical protein